MVEAISKTKWYYTIPANRQYQFTLEFQNQLRHMVMGKKYDNWNPYIHDTYSNSVIITLSQTKYMIVFGYKMAISILAAGL